jgi:hypothetical protein
MHLVGVFRLRSWIGAARQPSRQAQAWAGQVSTLQNAFDRPQGRNGRVAQMLQLLLDGGGTDQRIARFRGCPGFQATTDGKHSTLNVHRSAIGNRVVGPRQIVKTSPTCREITLPPLPHPSFGTAQNLADQEHRIASQAHPNRLLAIRQFILHGSLLLDSLTVTQRRL